MPDRRIATVTQINNYIKSIFEQMPVLSNIWIKGEISNLKMHSSGHIYLTLKDENSVIRAVMFRYSAEKLSFNPKDGTMVLARGKISVYERGGDYQLYIEEMEEFGKGDLYVQFEKLKEKLSKEGLFDEDKKKKICRFPQKIGIATSPTGAAVRDMINVLTRRYPIVEVILYPCLVQGENASKSIVKAIEYFNSRNDIDTLIVGRGGGSIEDLWAFNEEETARAIFNSKIPVISAVGHETDFTISDFAADLRAPTPSAGAELATPDVKELLSMVLVYKTKAQKIINDRIEKEKKVLSLLSERGGVQGLKRKIGDFEIALDREKERLFESQKRIDKEKRNSLSSLINRLDGVSPLSVMSRGYAFLSKDKKAVRSIDDINVNDKIVITLQDGSANCEVKEIEKNEI